MLIRTQDAVWAPGVSDADLLETYRAMTGDATFVAFDPPESARPRTAMAILAAEHAAGRAGVSKHAQPEPLTAAELRARMQEKVAAENSALDGSRKQKRANNFMEQDMARKKPAGADPSQRGRPTHPDFKVRATGAGKTKVRAESARGKLLAHIAASKKPTAVSDLDAAFERKTLGDVRVLIQLGHLVAVE